MTELEKVNFLMLAVNAILLVATLMELKNKSDWSDKSDKSDDNK